MNDAWEHSELPRSIVRQLDSPKSLAELSGEIGVTDARILWYLDRLEASDRVAHVDGRWRVTEAGRDFGSETAAESGDVTVMPGRTVYDFTQAFADADAGMFGPEFVRSAGEHGTRLSTERAREFGERLSGLISEYFGPGRADREATKYGFHWMLTPTDLHPLDDDA